MELPADSLSIGRGSVRYFSKEILSLDVLLVTVTSLQPSHNVN